MQVFAVTLFNSWMLYRQERCRFVLYLNVCACVCVVIVNKLVKPKSMSWTVKLSFSFDLGALLGGVSETQQWARPRAVPCPRIAARFRAETKKVEFRGFVTSNYFLWHVDCVMVLLHRSQNSEMSPCFLLVRIIRRALMASFFLLQVSEWVGGRFKVQFQISASPTSLKHKPDH